MLIGITPAHGLIIGSTQPAVSFAVSAPANAVGGVAFTVTVQARTSTGAIATKYNGTVHFTSTSGSVTLPANSTLTNGQGSFSATFHTAGTWTITATDTVNTFVTGTSGNIATVVYSPGSATWTSVGGQWWTAPANFNPNNNYVDCYGGGASSGPMDYPNSTGGGGGGGGAFSRKYNIPLLGGQSLLVTVGGDGGHSGVQVGGGAWNCLAYGGSPGYLGGSIGTGGAGGNGASGVGDACYSGGAGGNGEVMSGGGGGGGCAGPSGGGGAGTTPYWNGGVIPYGGAGGGGYAGAGGNGGWYDGSSNYNGNANGGAYGGGGGAVGVTSSGIAAGASGLVYLWWGG